MRHRITNDPPNLTLEFMDEPPPPPAPVAKVEVGESGGVLVVVDHADTDRREANPTRWEAARGNAPSFSGDGYEPEHDYERLTGQLAAVYNVMKDGRRRTLDELHKAVGKGTQTGISASLRALRKPIYGSHRVRKERRGDPKSGLWEYWIEK